MMYFYSKGLKMKYAGYIRISDPQQIGNYSLDAQRRAIIEFVQAKGGKLTEIYCDEAESARGTKKRDEFLRMRQDARKGTFQALVVHKFDRLNRNRADAMAVKMLLRKDLGIQVLSCTEPSEETAGAMGSLIEGILECVAEWYSNNLAAEVSKGK
jgi:site-specific DNA recombinase